LSFRSALWALALTACGATDLALDCSAPPPKSCDSRRFKLDNEGCVIGCLPPFEQPALPMAPMPVCDVAPPPPCPGGYMLDELGCIVPDSCVPPPPPPDLRCPPFDYCPFGHVLREDCAVPGACREPPMGVMPPMCPERRPTCERNLFNFDPRSGCIVGCKMLPPPLNCVEGLRMRCERAPSPTLCNEGCGFGYVLDPKGCLGDCRRPPPQPEPMRLECPEFGMTCKNGYVVDAAGCLTSCR
jgi:hypothetical protein